MKKIFAAVIIAASFVACSSNENKEKSTTIESTTSPDPATTEADKRAQEIADSTKMLDKKLADPNDPSTPDSLK